MAENITPMKISAKIALISHKLLAPIRANSAFFIFMYLLGILVAYIEIPHQPKATVYANLWAELFLDLYIVCLFLMIFPKHVRRWIRAILYFMLYGISLVDVFCWEKFQTTINLQCFYWWARPMAERLASFLQVISRKIYSFLMLA